MPAKVKPSAPVVDRKRVPVKVGRLVVSIEEFDRIDLNLDYDDNRLLRNRRVRRDRVWVGLLVLWWLGRGRIFVGRIPHANGLLLPLTAGGRAAEGDMKRIGDKERPSSEDWTGESRSSA
jgi:hypothetical protein